MCIYNNIILLASSRSLRLGPDPRAAAEKRSAKRGPEEKIIMCIYIYIYIYIYTIHICIYIYIYIYMYICTILNRDPLKIHMSRETSSCREPSFQSFTWNKIISTQMSESLICYWEFWNVGYRNHSKARAWSVFRSPSRTPFRSPLAHPGFAHRAPEGGKKYTIVQV